MTTSIEPKLLLLAKQEEKRRGKRNLPIIHAGTMEWDAWRHWRKDHGLGVVYMDSVGSITVPMELPPANIDAALQRSSDTGKLKGE